MVETHAGLHFHRDVAMYSWYLCWDKKKFCIATALGSKFGLYWRSCVRVFWFWLLFHITFHLFHKNRTFSAVFARSAETERWFSMFSVGLWLKWSSSPSFFILWESLWLIVVWIWLKLTSVYMFNCRLHILVRNCIGHDFVAFEFCSSMWKFIWEAQTRATGT